MQNELQHSAKGSHWQKKNHKYIAIENGRYIYPDVVGGAGKHHKTKSTFTLSKKKREQQAKVAETQARLDAEHRRLNTINKLDSKEAANANKKDYVTRYDSRGIATKVPKNSSLYQEEEAARAKQREKWTEGNRRAKQIADARTATKRAYYREKQLTKERQAASGYDEKGNKLRHVEPKGPASHDNRRFKKNLPAASTEYDEHGVKYTGRAARKHRILAEKAAKKAEREQKLKDKELKQQQKVALKNRAKAEKERKKEIDSQLPASMKAKRNIKKGKKAVSNLLNKLSKKNTQQTQQEPQRTEKWVDEQGRTHIPMNESYVYDKKAKKYRQVTK